jgi:hypothetical protein
MPSDARVAGTIANDNSIGVAAWSGLTNIASSNNVDATVTNSPGDISQYLKQTNYPFSIPAGALIVGIEVYIEHRANGSGRTEDYAVYLVKGGVISGTNKAVAGSWPGSDTGRTYGGPTDLWGLTLTRADVLSSDFGCVISTQETEDKSDDDTARIDVSTIRVYYTAGSPYTATVSPKSMSLSVPSVSATYQAVRQATVSPFVINISIPTTTAEFDEVYSSTVSPIVLVISIPQVTAIPDAVEVPLSIPSGKKKLEEPTYRTGNFEISLDGDVKLYHQTGTFALDENGEVVPKRKPGLNLLRFDK